MESNLQTYAREENNLQINAQRKNNVQTYTWEENNLQINSWWKPSNLRVGEKYT